jgi:hypothetical protein
MAGPGLDEAWRSVRDHPMAQLGETLFVQRGIALSELRLDAPVYRV